MAVIEEDRMQPLVRMGSEQILQIDVESGIVGFHRAAGDFFPGGGQDKRARGAYRPKHFGVLAVDPLRRNQRAMKGAEAADQTARYGFRVCSRKRLEDTRHERYVPFRRTRRACRAIPAKSTTSSR